MKLFRPMMAGAHLPERLIACIGAAICIALSFVVCAGLPLAAADLPIIVAPLGASAVLVFAIPASPLAQPWPVIGGNMVSALVGVGAFIVIPNLTVAAGIAVGGAILAMSLLRCLHPPGGAAALTAVIGSHGIHAAGFAFAFAPVGINSIALVSLAVVFHRATARSYPHQPAEIPEAAAMLGRHLSDIDAALEEMHESFDISREDLDALLTRAELHSEARLAGRPGPLAGPEDIAKPELPPIFRNGRAPGKSHDGSDPLVPNSNPLPQRSGTEGSCKFIDFALRRQASSGALDERFRIKSVRSDRLPRACGRFGP